MTIGFHAPLPPARTGVAGYAAALLGALKQRAKVVLDGSRAAVHLYHLGNNQLHAGIYRRALARPGVVVLHDAVLQHFFLGLLSEQDYIGEFVYNYGEWHRGLARDLWRRRSRSAQDPEFFRYPMLRRIAEVSHALVVHNPAAGRMVREHAPAAKVVEIPHLFCPPPAPHPSEIARWRAARGIAADMRLFGVFGHLRESKRLLPVLRAFQSVRGEAPGVRLLLAGDIVSSDLARAARPWLEEPGVIRCGYLEEREFWLAAAATDVCLNLRYPAAGETSGIAIRMMGIGKALIASAGEELARFPAEACLRVDPGVTEQPLLAAYMRWLAADPEAVRTLGRHAAGHIARFHSLGQVAARYLDALLELSQAHPAD